MDDSHLIEARSATDNGATGQQTGRVEVLSLVLLGPVVPLGHPGDRDRLRRLHVGLLAQGVGDVAARQVPVHRRGSVWTQATHVPNLPMETPTRKWSKHFICT